MVPQNYQSVQECLKDAQQLMGRARTVAGQLYKNPADGYTSSDSAKEKKVQIKAKKLEYEDIPTEIFKNRQYSSKEVESMEMLLYSCVGRLYSTHIKLDADLNGPLGDLLEELKGTESFEILRLASEIIGVGSSLIRILADRINWQSIDNLSLKINLCDCITDKYQKQIENMDKMFVKNFINEVNKYKRLYENK